MTPVEGSEGRARGIIDHGRADALIEASHLRVDDVHDFCRVAAHLDNLALGAVGGSAWLPATEHQ